MTAQGHTIEVAEPKLPLCSRRACDIQTGQSLTTLGQKVPGLQTMTVSAGEMVQPIKSLLCKHKDLTPIPSTYGSTHLKSSCRKVKTGGSLGSLVRQSS